MTDPALSSKPRTYPYSWDRAALEKLHERLVDAHVSALLGGEKLSAYHREKDAQMIRPVVTEAAQLVAELLEKPADETTVRLFAYECPKYCGCWWRDNFDGTMSLFDGDQKSCKVCENLPLEKLVPLSVADHAFIDNRGDGRWLVCVGKVHSDEHSARKECRRWIAAFSKQPPITSDALDAARYRWLRTRINYMDKDRGISTARTAPVLHYKARVWSHESYDMEADTIDATIDRALAKSAPTTDTPR